MKQVTHTQRLFVPVRTQKKSLNLISEVNINKKKCSATSVQSENEMFKTHAPVPAGLVFHFENRFARLLPRILLYLSCIRG